MSATRAHIERAVSAAPTFVRKFSYLRPGHPAWDDACQEAAVGVLQAVEQYEATGGDREFFPYAMVAAKHRLWRWMKVERRDNEHTNGAFRFEEMTESEDADGNSSYADVLASTLVYERDPNDPESRLIEDEEKQESFAKAATFISKLPPFYWEAAQAVVYDLPLPRQDHRTLSAIRRIAEGPGESLSDVKLASLSRRARREVMAARALEAENHRKAFEEERRARWAKRLEEMAEHARKRRYLKTAEAYEKATPEEREKLPSAARRAYAKLCADRAARRTLRRAA